MARRGGAREASPGSRANTGGTGKKSQPDKGWDFTLTMITSMILLVTLCMTIFSLITKGYDTYSSSMLMIFGWGCVAFCAVVALVLSQVKDR